MTLPAGEFEGPLDLLLHLCQKHELDILEIPISFVTEKYLEYLGVMQLMDLDLMRLYKEGKIAIEEAYVKARSKKEFEKYMPQSPGEQLTLKGPTSQASGQVPKDVAGTPVPPEQAPVPATPSRSVVQ